MSSRWRERKDLSFSYPLTPIPQLSLQYDFILCQSEFYLIIRLTLDLLMQSNYSRTKLTVTLPMCASSFATTFSPTFRARGKALLTPVPRYCQAWVQVSPHSSYKVLKWVRRDHSTRPTTNQSAQNNQTSAPCCINDPNTIDGSSNEANVLEDDDDGGGSERNGDSPVAGASPSRLSKLGQKTSRAIGAETEGTGGQLAGLETGHIAGEIKMDEDKEEDRSVSGTQDHSVPVAPTPSDPQVASGKLPLPKSQANKESRLKEIDMEEQSYNDVIDDQPYENKGADVIMCEGDEVSGQAQWTGKNVSKIGLDHALGLEKPLDGSVMPSPPTEPPVLSLLPSIVPNGHSIVEETEHSKAPKSSQSYDHSLPLDSLQPWEISDPMEAATPQNQEAIPNEPWHQSEAAELSESHTTISSGTIEVTRKDLEFSPIPGLGIVDHEGSLTNSGSQPITEET
ncbi:uncharacterized protein MELLADRAFT_59437 [Melampsora larici-populina 98AG31]|uniref:Uncharacterized protein n=1 Tax=Melampsora larici-populina (strain 98AG31 / pathotype 3-4-7) TaxID=747676 RepID=F4R7H0_MELLP|nr:uncharacterized protein MELLADRAFT_59437 [Melampsora larici-populina 98AG31]EGG11315.1 hypothetical protein MELLADRAFT_59437 [Melampsora larici-populina 98AG31]